ncbi:hypothetical protein ACC691_36585, partial [Rhizobium johnstonii]|uniref:hypothetical protein n=1 Tax=Rhizobium johnstonii TaxID=3019933 RepID=UPI003F997922
VRAAVAAAAAFLAVILIRAAYVFPLLRGLRRSAERSAKRGEGLEAIQERIDLMVAGGDDAQAAVEAVGAERARERGDPLTPPRPIKPAQAEQFRSRARRFLADVDYMQAEPLGPREGVLVVWAGMRGVVTVAAAQ